MSIRKEDTVVIAQTWGWSNPSASVLRVAEEAALAQTLDVAELLVELEIISREQSNKLMASRPHDVKALTWMAQRDPSVSPSVDRIMALVAKHPYYAKLSDLAVHDCMYDKEVKVRADAMDAAVMLIEDTVPVLVFSTFSGLLDFKSMGRAEQRSDPIVKNVTSEVRLAVGSRDEISAILRNVLSSEDIASAGELANVWIAESAENRTKPENREITRLIDHALTIGATDIALMPQRNGEMKVQLRRFGDMISPKAVSNRINAEMATQIVQLLQSRSGANPTNTQRREPTNGQISYRSGSGDVFLRLSFIPMNHLGELRNLTSVSARLLPRAEASISLDDLRLDPIVIEQIKLAVRVSQGLILVVGPTNSGKSTTVAGAIGEHVALFGDKKKRVSVEDPIERFLHGIQQYNAPTHLADRAKMFEVILSAFKRHDPDLVWVGEVQDKVTADLCVSIGSTGHLALSTLHANDTTMGFDVLAKSVSEDKRFQLVEAISLVISQRTVKRLCPHCRIVGEPTESEKSIFSHYCSLVGDTATLPATVARANPEGCEKCGGDGFIGLLPINEVLPFSRKAKDAAIDMISGLARRETLAQHRTLKMLDSGVALLSRHEVDLDAILV